jgi:cell division protein ZapA
MGQSYLLGCPEGGEIRLREAVERVDGAMCRIRDAGKIRARDRIAVLAALNLAFDLSDRTAMAVGPHAAPAAAATSVAHGAQGEEAARVQQLLARLDQVLADDGRLL